MLKLAYPANTDVFKTSSGHLRKVSMSYNHTRSHHDVLKKIWDVLKISDLRRLEDVQFTTS